MIISHTVSVLQAIEEASSVCAPIWLCEAAYAMILALKAKFALVSFAIPPDLISLADLSLLELTHLINILRNESTPSDLFIVNPLSLIDLAISITTNSLSMTHLSSNFKLAEIKLALYHLQRSLFDLSLGLVLSKIANIELAKLGPFFLFKILALDGSDYLP